MGGKYASIAPAWRRAWQEVIPFFAFDPAIRKIIYTTNAIESLNRGIRPVKARFQAFSGCQCHGMSSSMRLIL